MAGQFNSRVTNVGSQLTRSTATKGTYPSWISPDLRQRSKWQESERPKDVSSFLLREIPNPGATPPTLLKDPGKVQIGTCMADSTCGGMNYVVFPHVQK